MNGLPEIMSFWAWVWLVVVPVVVLFVALCIFAWPGEPAQPTNEEELAELAEEQKRA